MSNQNEQIFNGGYRAMGVRQFDIADVITCITGRIVSPRHMDAVYDLFNFVTRDKLFTHQPPRTMDECKRYLIDACPRVNEVDFDELDRMLAMVEHEDLKKAACLEWIKMEQSRLNLPDTVELKSIPRDDHDVIDPIEELKQMNPDAKIMLL